MQPPGAGPSLAQLDPVEMQAWVIARSDKIVARWLSEVTKRFERRPRQLVELLHDFYETFVSILPEILGPYRRRVRPVWQEAANLYGELAAERGLVAGEVIEEFQVLRVSLIRVLYAEPRMPRDVVPGMREVLRLNRLVDQGVTHASIGYTDSLVSALVAGPGVPESVTEELLTRVAEQLRAIRREFRDIVGSGRG
ncbi:MAG: hypothetical protein OXR82_02910 [Gammaproteobacteria bacterium]|nr:hypothetical protein [Gammaproteobacteria bacterium]MDE0257327.1 hypothetical protein [Gammaproteobacteria bacterium]